MNPLVKVLMSFGGTIIQEPLNIVNRQLDHYQNRKNMKLEQELRQEDARFNQQLEMERAKMNAELDDMVARKEIERGALVLKAMQDYNKTVSECAVSIGNSLGKMSIELRRQAHELVLEKKQAYLDMQEKVQQDAMKKFEEIAKRFPEGSKARDTMEEAVGKQLFQIMDSAGDFMKVIDTDFANMLANIDNVVGKTTDHLTANQPGYLNPGSQSNLLLNKA